MGSMKQEDLTGLLVAWGEGDDSAFDELLNLVYPELHRLAERALVRQPNSTFSATDVVQEAYLRLVDQRRVGWKNRNHFFAIAATVMRRVLCDKARRKYALKRGREAIHVEFVEAAIERADPADLELVVLLDDALEKMAKFKPLWVRIVELRFFLGLTIHETSEVLESSPDKVRQRWNAARRWLYHILRDQGK